MYDFQDKDQDGKTQGGRLHKNGMNWKTKELTAEFGKKNVSAKECRKHKFPGLQYIHYIVQAATICCRKKCPQVH